MPTYEFKCDRCHEVIERIMEMGAPTPSRCPHCGRFETLHKKISCPAVHYRGEGFYSTQNRKKESALPEASENVQKNKNPEYEK